MGSCVQLEESKKVLYLYLFSNFRKAEEGAGVRHLSYNATEMKDMYKIPLIT